MENDKYSNYPLLKFWFSPENEQFWFNCNTEFDKMITEKFSNMLYSKPLLEYENHLDILENIILYDQITRHIYRNKHIPDDFSNNALKLTNNLINSIKFNQLLSKEKCFCLMPLRHTKQKKDLVNVLNIITQLRDNTPDDTYYNRFYKATVSSLAGLNNNLSSKEYKSVGEIDISVLCEKCNFISSLGFNNSINHSEWKLLIKEFNDNLSHDKIYTLSISGGVDSMVCSYLLKILGYKYIHFMINYNNRESSNKEVDLVCAWSHLLNIPLYVRKIDEIQRTRDKDREFYEKISNKIRYEMYKLLGNEVILGHNFNDTFENVITNIKKKKNYNNLLGMEIDSIINGTQIKRPVLNIKKTLLFKFASEHNIPFLYDSTPSWSERGKIRDTLVGSINEYDKNLINDFIEMSKFYSDMYKNYEDIVINNVNFIKLNESEFLIKNILSTKFSCLKIIFNTFTNKYNLNTISDKSLNNLNQRYAKKIYGRIEFNKNIYGIISSDNNINIKCKI